MADDKIRVSWDDLSRPEVDDRVKQQELLARAQERAGQSSGASSTFVAQSKTKASLWYNTLFYMALFGFVGGLVASLPGEIIWNSWSDPLHEYQEYNSLIVELVALRSRGEITAENAIAVANRLDRQFAANAYVQLDKNSSLSGTQKEALFKSMIKKDKFRSNVKNFLWYSTVGVVISLFLSMADQIVARNLRGTVINGTAGIVLGVLAGLVIWFSVDIIYHAFGGGQNAPVGTQILARSVAWGVFGLFLALAPGVVLLNWKRLLIGLAGGFFGGLVGGALFDPIGIVGLYFDPEGNFRQLSGGISRMVGLTTIGLIAGVGTGLIEQVAKSGWIKIIGGLIAGKQFVIYKNPTYIGSAPQCEIYLFKDPQVGSQHAAIHRLSGGFEIEDLRSPTGTIVNGRAVSRQRLRNGDQIQIGMTTLQFQERQRTQGA